MEDLPIYADTCVGDVGCPSLSHVAGEVGAHVPEGVERPHRELYTWMLFVTDWS
jgi:hypothetical protein